MKDDRERKGRYIRLVGTLSMVPFLMATGPLVGFFMGKWLDSVFSTRPVLSFVFTVLGFIAGIREMVRLVRKASRELDRL